MPVDKFGHTNRGATQRIYHRVVSKISDIAPRDYVSGMRVSPGSLVRNTTSGIVYRFEGTAGPITTAPALSPNWRPTTGSVICSLRESEEENNDFGEEGLIRLKRLNLNTIAINTDSAFTTADGKIIIPRTGVYRLSGFVNLWCSESEPFPIKATYTIHGISQLEPWAYTACAADRGIRRSIVLPSPAVSLRAGQELEILIESNIRYAALACRLEFDGGCGLQAEFLY